MDTTIMMWNPDWDEETIEKAKRGELEPACHDGSDHLGVVCAAGHQNHLHRTQIEPMPHGADVVARCQFCPRMIGPITREEILAALDEAWGRNRG